MVSLWERRESEATPVQGRAKEDLQLWVCKARSLFLYYYLLIIVLFSTRTAVNLLHPTVYRCVSNQFSPWFSLWNCRRCFIESKEGCRSCFSSNYHIVLFLKTLYIERGSQIVAAVDEFGKCECPHVITVHQEIEYSGASSQDGSVGRYTLLPCTPKRRVTTNLKTKINQNCQKIELHESLTTKELRKKHSSRLVGGVERTRSKVVAGRPGSPIFACE